VQTSISIVEGAATETNQAANMVLAASSEMAEQTESLRARRDFPERSQSCLTAAG